MTIPELAYHGNDRIFYSLLGIGFSALIAVLIYEIAILSGVFIPFYAVFGWMELGAFRLPFLVAGLEIFAFIMLSLAIYYVASRADYKYADVLTIGFLFILLLIIALETIVGIFGIGVYVL